MPARVLDEGQIKALVRNYVDPLLTKFREQIYGSGASYGTKISATVIPDGMGVSDDHIRDVITAAGFIKGIKTYLSAVLKGSDQTELNFVGLGVTAAGVRTTVTYTAGSGVPRVIAGWYSDDIVTVGSGFGPVYQIDAPVTISGLWGNTKYNPASGTHTFDIGWSTNLTSWSSIYSVKPTLPSGSRTFTQGTLSKTTFDTNDFIRFDVVSLPSTVSSGITAQLRVIGR